MANFSNSISYNSIPLTITSMTPTKNQGTRKSVIGRTLVMNEIIGYAGQHWNLKIAGIIYGTTSANLSTNRANLEALDVVEPYAYVDGIHDGNYYIDPGTLQFDDQSSDVGSLYRYSMVLVEE